MPNETTNGSAQAGSPGFQAGSSPDKSGQLDNAISKEQYESLEKKLGEQGKELGDYRSFVKNIEPLLDKLDSQPELIQAILDGKIDAELAKAAMEGKISAGAAQEVSEAHDKVKKDMGTTYDKATPDAIEKRVEQELAKVKDDFDKKLKESEEMRNFKDQVNDFISNTKDFPVYAEEIERLILENPKIDDIELAYHVVKGKRLQEEAAKTDVSAAGEAAKEMAANAAGGRSQGGTLVDDQSVIDKLISSRSNPNVL